MNAASTLSERQRLCLRLVAQGLTSKEIALRTGLTPQTVDTYIKSAMAKMAASSRREAARALAEEEISQRLGSPPDAIASLLPAAHSSGAAHRSRIVRLLAPPPIGGKLNELSVTERIFAVLRVAGTSAIVISSLVLLIAGVMMTFR